MVLPNQCAKALHFGAGKSSTSIIRGRPELAVPHTTDFSGVSQRESIVGRVVELAVPVVVSVPGAYVTLF